MTDLGVRCEAHVGEVFPPRCSACDAALEVQMREALAGSLTSDVRSRAIVAGYLDDGDEWAVARGEEDPWGRDLDGDNEPF